MTAQNQAILSPELVERLRAVIPQGEKPYVLTHTRQRLYSRALAKLREAHHGEFELLYIAEVTAFCEEQEESKDV